MLLKLKMYVILVSVRDFGRIVKYTMKHIVWQ